MLEGVLVATRGTTFFGHRKSRRELGAWGPLDEAEYALDGLVDLGGGVVRQEVGAEEAGNEAGGIGPGAEADQVRLETVGGDNIGAKAAPEQNAEEVDLALNAGGREGSEGAALGGGEVVVIQVHGGGGWKVERRKRKENEGEWWLVGGDR
jgi:hypothetical protein